MHGTSLSTCLVVAAMLGSCYRGQTSAIRGSTTTNSAVPCLEACAGDPFCKSHCFPVGNLPPPPGIMYQR